MSPNIQWNNITNFFLTPLLCLSYSQHHWTRMISLEESIFTKFIVFQRYDFLSFNILILQESTNTFVIKKNFPRFYVIRKMWTIQRHECKIRNLRQQFPCRTGYKNKNPIIHWIQVSHDVCDVKRLKNWNQIPYYMCISLKQLVWGGICFSNHIHNKL
jgi:hypothetical protein